MGCTKSIEAKIKIPVTDFRVHPSKTKFQQNLFSSFRNKTQRRENRHDTTLTVYFMYAVPASFRNCRENVPAYLDSEKKQ